MSGEGATCGLFIAIDALEAVGASKDDVVRSRVMLTDMTRWNEAANVHGEYLSMVRPACTFVEVSRFIDARWLVEIELDAVLGHR